MALTTTEEALVRQLLEQQAAILSLAESESTIISKLGATKVTIADLTSASSISDSDLFLIRQGTTEKNVSGAVVKTLASSTVDGATETSAGIVELATAAETQTGTDNSRAVHPAGLASLTANETRKGLIEIANASEAQTGTDTERAITPAGLRSGVNATGSAPIYACRAWVNFNATGTLNINASGNVSSITDNGVGDYTINFTTAMPDANYTVAGFTVGWSTTYPLYGITFRPSGDTTPGQSPTLKTSSKFRIIHGQNQNPILSDSADCSIMVFR